MADVVNILLPDEVQQRLFDNNARLSEHHLAEICGDAAFNGNLHPPLLPWELSYPTGESGPSQAQLRTAEILVARDPDDPDALCLLHRGTAKRVLPVDLGFLNARMRPPLYQLLSRFTPPASFGPQVPETPGVAADERPSGPQTDRETSREAAPEEKPAVSPEEVFYRPRITYRGSLVLGRRLWIVPAAAFPKPRNDETPARYYLRVRRWRSRHGIPAEVFLQVRPLGSAGPSPAAADGPADGAPAEGAAETPAEGAAETGGEEPVAEESAGAAAAAASPGAAPRPGVGQKAGAAKAARPAGPSLRSDLYKPQYIDFHNPLLLDLFSKAPGPLEDFLIVLAERLPAREHLPSHGDDRFATELVVQIDFASHGAGGPERHVD